MLNGYTLIFLCLLHTWRTFVAPQWQHLSLSVGQCCQYASHQSSSSGRVRVFVDGSPPAPLHITARSPYKCSIYIRDNDTLLSLAVIGTAPLPAHSSAISHCIIDLLWSAFVVKSTGWLTAHHTESTFCFFYTGVTRLMQLTGNRCSGIGIAVCQRP